MGLQRSNALTLSRAMVDLRSLLSRIPQSSRPRYLARRAWGALPGRSDRLPPAGAEFESRLVWMLGSPRTGSTWLLRLLIHPLYLAETPVGVNAPLCARGKPSLVPLDETRLLDHLTPPARAFAQAAEVVAPPDFGTQVLPGLLAERPTYFFSEEYAEDWRPAVRELVLSRLRTQVERAARELGLANPFVLVKEPQSQGAELLMPLIPRSRVLFLMRDGREVLRSQLALRTPGGRLAGAASAPRAGDDQGRRRFVIQQARRWVQRMASVQTAYEAHSPDLRIKVRYEDLNADPESELRRLTDWIGLGRTHAQLGAAIDAEATRRRSSATGRKSAIEAGERDPRHWELNAEERRLADEVMGPMLDKLGYPTW